jgi:phenylacetate-CoA ligase
MKYNTLLQKIIFPMAELVSGSSIQKKMIFLEKSQYWSRKKIEEYQNKRLRELIRHAYDNVPYYRKTFDKLGIKPLDIKTRKDLNMLPILTKQIIKDNMEDLRARNYKNRSYPMFTSGSTGTPMVFYQTKEDFSWFWAVEFRGWKEAGYDFGDRYVKLSLNPRTKATKKFQDKIMRCHYIYSSMIENKDIIKELENINKFRPKFLYGYTSTISIIAKYMKENNLNIKMNGVFTFGDNMTSQYRDMIRSVFKCKVYDSYGCGGEGLHISFQCEKGKYHINDELTILDSRKGNAIVTSLNNYAMPLINYMPNDLITLGGSCDCGKNLSIMKSIDGRSTDMVLASNGNRIVVHYFTTFFEHIKTIEQFKIIQKDKKGIIIQLVIKKENNKKDIERKVIEYIQKAAGKLFRIRFEYPEAIGLEKNGKRKIIDNRLK